MIFGHGPPSLIDRLFPAVAEAGHDLVYQRTGLLRPEDSLLFPEDSLLFPEDSLLFPEDRLPITPRPFRGGVRGGVNQKMSHPIF